MLWHTQKQHMHQTIKIHEHKLIYLCQQVDLTSPWTHMGPPKKNPNIGISWHNSLISTPLYPPIPYTITYWNPCKILLILIWLNSSNNYPPIQPLYKFWIHIIPQILIPKTNNFNYRQKSHLRRDYCEGRSPLSFTSWMRHFWHWNDTPRKTHKADITTKSYSVIIFNKMIRI